MFDFFKSFFKPEKPSSTQAKERLRLVLLSDHISLSPEIIESLKADLLSVISRYVEIDSGSADVTFEHREHEIAMLASVPITGLRDRRPPPPRRIPSVVPVAEARPLQAQAEPAAVEASAARAFAPDVEVGPALAEVEAEPSVDAPAVLANEKPSVDAPAGLANGEPSVEARAALANEEPSVEARRALAEVEAEQPSVDAPAVLARP